MGTVRCPKTGCQDPDANLIGPERWDCAETRANSLMVRNCNVLICMRRVERRSTDRRLNGRESRKSRSRFNSDHNARNARFSFKVAAIVRR